MTTVRSPRLGSLGPVVVVMLCALLAGCATVAGLADIGTGPADANCEGPLLQPWRTLSGGPLTPDPFLSSVVPGQSQGARVRLLAPIAVAARANDVFVVDAGRQAILRFDRSFETASVFAEAVDVTVRGEADLYVDDALSVFFLSSGNREVVQFSRDGTVVQRYANVTELPQPIAVVAAEDRGEVLVADALRAHILAFNQLGAVTRGLSISANAPIRFENIAGMARGPDGVYVVDRLARQVHVLSLDGAYGYSFGDGDLTMPGAIAVDQFNRVFVADNFDNSVKVFVAGRLDSSGAGVQRGRFQQIFDLWVDEGLLYVADGPSARIEILWVQAPCP